MNCLPLLKHWVVGSKPTGDMNVSECLFRVCIVLFVGIGLATG
jgi:hypothetical protein